MARSTAWRIAGETPMIPASFAAASTACSVVILGLHPAQAPGRQRVRVRVGLDDARREEQVQLRRVALAAGAPEETSQDRDAGEDRDSRRAPLPRLVGQAAQDDGLRVPDEDLGSRFPRGDDRGVELALVGRGVRNRYSSVELLWRLELPKR